MKILHIITHFELGGAERVALSIAKSNNPNIQYHLVSVVKSKSEYHDSFIRECEQNGIIIHESSVMNNKLAILLFPIWFTWTFLKIRPNIIHTHTEIPDMSVFLWHLLFGWLFPDIHYVRTIHNTKLWTKWENVGKFVESFYKKEHANVAISESAQISYSSIYDEKPPIIFNGVEEVKQIRFENIENDRINILFAGRLEYQKGIDELIAVLNHYNNDNRFQFYVIGDGELKYKFAPLNQCSNISYLDKIYGLSSYIASFDYLFMPSHFEGFGLMSVEASMAKVPTIINRCPGLIETLPTDWPLAVNDNNIEEYFNIFDNLYKYDKASLGQIAYDYVQDKFSIKKMQNQYEKLYCKLHL